MVNRSRFPDHRPRGRYVRSALMCPDVADRRADSFDPVGRGTSSQRWRRAWSRPRSGTTPVASGLRSTVCRVMASASWPISCPDGPGKVNVVEIRVISGRIDPPAGRPQPRHRSCPGHDGLPAMGPGARLVGDRWVSDGAVAGLDLLHHRPQPSAPGLRPMVKTFVACGGTGIAGIGQLADGLVRRGRDDGGVEIRIVLDRAEPPAGRLRVLCVPGRLPGPAWGGTSGSPAGWGCCGRCMR